MFQRPAAKPVRSSGLVAIVAYGVTRYIADGVGSKRVSKAMRRSPWKMALWGGLLGVFALLLGEELLSGDPDWWLVALRVLMIAALGMNLYVESRKPKAALPPA